MGNPNVSTVSDDPATLTSELAAVDEQLAEARVIRRHLVRNPERFSAEEREAALERADQLAQRRVELAVQSERHRIARDLHDGPLQALSNLVLEAEVMERLLQRDPDRVAGELADFKNVVREVVADVRRQLAALGPAALETEDLVPALRRLAADWQRDTGAECRVRVAGEERPVPPGLQQVIYWIAAEALSNVRRHADARRVAIDLEIRGDAARIRIRDDGKGFDVTAVAPAEDPPRLGLLGMRERALGAGGNLEVRSRPGAGTLVEAEVAMVG